ncbi:MAG TPA: FHA domain-containing protein [Gemmatimonadaceae bacterium]|jgi:ABC-type multidrug transport system ATPase subunit
MRTVSPSAQVAAPTVALRDEVWLEPTVGDPVQVPDDGSPLLIGRQSSSHLVISDAACSRDHAAVRYAADGVWLEPRSLRQSTVVNDARHDQAVRIVSGDVLRFGSVEVYVSFVPRADAPIVAAPKATRSSAPATALAEPGAFQQETASVAAVNVTESLVLGRGAAAPGKLVLDHPTISTRHAAVIRQGERLAIRDLGSTNGTFVNGSRVSGAPALSPGDRIRVGPFTFVVDGTTLAPLRADAAQLTASAVTLDVAAGGTTKRLLNGVSIGVRASEFVAIIGPSGCGKSTLLRILSGRSRPTGGSVSWNGADLHASFDALKSELAFVPQRETLPEQLTVRQALTYTARLRLPSDIDGAERARIVEDTIATVGLTAQADLRIARLSGGQRKRASLGNELLVSPSMMFLDEVTSGLDDATDREMMALFRRLADRGIVVVCVTHTLANVEGTCDSLIVMAVGGSVAYHGPLGKACEHFGINRLGDVYPTLSARNPDDWAARHAATSPFRGRATVVPTSKPGDASASKRHDRRMPLSQLPVLCERYLEVTIADLRTLGMAGLQSIVIAGFLRLVFGTDAAHTPREALLVFLLGVSAFWFGCNNAAKEIVKERGLFTLERNVNLRLPSYLWSKVIVLGLIGAIQTAILFAVSRLLGLSFAHPVGVFGVMAVTVLAGTTCGLAISALAGSEDQAITIVPIVLIPQLLLSDAVVSPLTKAATWVAKAGITTFWDFRALRGVLEYPGIETRPAMLMLGAHAAAYALIALGGLKLRDLQRGA